MVLININIIFFFQILLLYILFILQYVNKSRYNLFDVNIKIVLCGGRFSERSELLFS